ncbi:MAG TPA: hypothetical protein ENF33_05005 [Nitrososphaeria archaeon]|nr:hypothetical protein [Nitrososphaeria archaeon]
MGRGEPIIGLLASDMRFGNKVKEVASTLGVGVKHVLSLDELPLSIRVVIAEKREGVDDQRRIILYKDDYDSIEELVERASEIAVGELRYRLAAAAIDPGKSIGVAYILNHRVIRTKRYGIIEGLLDDLSRFMKSHSRAEKKYVLIGATSNPENAKVIARKIMRALYGEGVIIKLVDESNTSKGLIPRMRGMSKDEYSALILSLRNILKLR